MRLACSCSPATYTGNLTSLAQPGNANGGMLFDVTAT